MRGKNEHSYGVFNQMHGLRCSSRWVVVMLVEEKLRRWGNDGPVFEEREVTWVSLHMCCR